MKNFTFKAILVMALFMISFHQAGWGQLLYDDFTGYTPGVLAGQGSWVKGGSGPDVTVANATPLTFTGYNGGGAEYVVMPTGTGTSSRVFKLFTPVTSYSNTTFYFSFLLKLSAVSANSNGYFLTIGNASGASQYGSKIYAKSSGSGFNIGISKQTTTVANIAYGGSVFNLDQTYLIVVKYVFNTVADIYDDQAYLWVDPVITLEPSTATAECAINGGAATDTDFDGYGAITGGVGSFMWHNRNVTNPTGSFDAVRVGHGITSADAWTNLGAGSTGPTVETPVISPPGGIFETTQTVTITCATPDALIYYSTDGQPPDDSSNPYDPLNPPQVSTTTTIMAIAYKDPLPPSSIASAVFRFPISVPNIAALQAGIKDGFTVYKLTAEAIVTFTRPPTGSNQKFVQDATGAVLIYDPAGIITTVYAIGDGVTGITGTLTLYNSLLEFVPTSDPGAPTSTGNVIVPEVKTLATLTSGDQSKLVSIARVTFDVPGGLYVASTNYPITDPSGAGVFRTGFGEADYIGTVMPAGAQNMVALVGQYGATMQITPRNLADIVPSPVMSVDPTTLSGFTYFLGAGPSASQSFAITGSNLIPGGSNLTVTGSTNYEVANDDVNFGPTALIEYTGGSLTAVNAYVRLKAGLTTGDYNGETVTVSGGEATTQNVTCSGTVLPPAPAIIVGSVTGFGAQVVNTISAEKNYTVSGDYLTADIVITPPTGFEISLGTGGGFVPTNPITLTQVSGTVPPTTIYVRFVPVTIQSYLGNITHTSTGATTQNVAVSGIGIWAEPTNHVTGFAAGSTTLTEIPLTWTDATGGTLPEAYLIKGSATSFAAIVDPVDGVPEADGALVQNVLQGTGTYTFTGLNPATTYYFKIYPYTNSFTNIDYKISPAAPEASATTAEPPVFSYTWIGTDGGLWTDAVNWTPSRTTPLTNDILIFDGTVTATANVTGIIGQTIGKLQIINNANVTFSAGTSVGGAGTIARTGTAVTGTGTAFTTQLVVGDFIYTGAGSSMSVITVITDATHLTTGESGTIAAGTSFSIAPRINVTTASGLEIASGSLTISSASPVAISIASGTSGSITGNITFTNNAHRLTAAGAGGLTFNSPAVFTAGTLFAGNAFGGSGTAGSVIFASGSTYVHQAGSNPFVTNSPNSIAVFQTGSLYKLIGSLTPSFSGKTYANFELDAPTVTVTTTGGSAVNMDNLTITNGTLNFNMTGTPGHSIKGNIHVAATGTLNFSPASAGTVLLNGSAQQTISGEGTITGSANSTLEISNASGIGLTNNVRINGILKLTNGLVDLGVGILTLGPAATISGTPSATAMIVATSTGDLRKEFSAIGSFIFPVGSSTPTAEYSPVTLNFTSGSFASAFAGVNLSNTKYPTDPNTGNYLNRYWNITQSGITGFTCDATFQYLPGDVHGIESQIYCVRVDPTPYVAYDAANTSLHQLTAVGLTSLSTFTGTVAVPELLNVTDETVSFGQTKCYNATQTITVAGNNTTFLVETGGEATLIAGQNIIFLPGTTVQPGGHLWAYITQTSSYCGAKAPAIVTAETKELSVTTLQSNKSTFKVYPNPTSGMFNLDMTGLDASSSVNVEIYRITGEPVVKETLTGESQNQFNLQNQPTGIYILRILNSDMAGTVKIIKQ